MPGSGSKRKDGRGGVAGYATGGINHVDRRTGGGTAAGPVAVPAASVLGRSSGRKRRKTWRAMEAAQESDESDASAENAESAPCMGGLGGRGGGEGGVSDLCS